MNLPNLPVENWHQILQQSISLPGFLEPDYLPEVTDPFFGFHKRHELVESYWAMERHRKNLRLVCKSWDEYLHQFSHRFIRLFDVYHQNVPKTAFRKAKRIGYGLCGNHNCTKCHFVNELGQWSDLIAETGDLSVEIIDAPRLTEIPLARALINNHKSMPLLKVMVRVVITDVMSQDWTETISSSPCLKVADFAHDSLQQQTLHSSSLTTLSYRNNENPFSLLLNDINLPALRHLRLTPERYTLERQIEHLIPLLERIGRNLVTLQIGLFHSIKFVPQEIWEVCPRLQRLDSALRLPHSPPSNHPLHTISIFIPYVHTNAVGRILVSPFPTSLHDWVSLRQVIINNGWKLVFGITHVDILRSIRQWVNTCKRCCVDLKDAWGVLFEDSGLERYLPE